MFKTILIIAFIIATASALTFSCACVVGSRYDERTEEAQSQLNKNF